MGVEPNADMRGTAARHATANVEYVDGLSHHTGLPDGGADIVLAVQSLHWMEPVSTFAEVARILRPGGVFAAIDSDWPPLIGDADAEAEWDRCHARARRGEDALANGLRGEALVAALDVAPDAVGETLHTWDAAAHRDVAIGVHRWGKHQHRERMEASGRFTVTRDIALHCTETGSADRFVDLLRSQGGLQTLLAHGVSEADLGVTALRARCRQRFGTAPRRLWFTYRARLGVV